MSCELCDQAGGELVWNSTRCRVVRVAEADYPGFCRVVWNAHVAEMSDLSPADRAYMLEVVLTVEQALRDALTPDKINLASLGNLVPHLHWHVIPRFRDDRHFPNPIWGEALRPASPPRDTTRLNALLAERLSPLG